MFAIMLAVFALVPLTAGAQTPKLEKTSVHVAVGGKTLVAYLPLTIAERRGYFAKQGLQVEISDFQGGARAMQALVGGSADIVCGAYEHTILMAAKGVNVKAIALQNDASIIGVGGGPSAVAAMKSGQLDAMANFDPVMSVLERDGVIVPVVDTRKHKDLDDLYGGPFAASAFILDARFPRQYPNTTQAFVN